MADMLHLEFTVAGQYQLSRALGLYADRAHDLRPAWEDIRDDFLRNEMEQFESEGRHASGGWAELSPIYAAWKNAHLPGMPILQLSGRLMDSLTDKRHADFVFEAKRKSLRMGTKVPYARFHQEGTRTMPDRPPIALTDKQRRLWVKIIQTHIFQSGQPYRRAVF